MARSVLALAALALVCTCANAQMRATFEQAYSLQQSDLLADTQQLANSVWDLVCINDCTTTTPAQNHSVSADKNIYFNPKFTEATPYLDYINGVGQVARYQFVDQINDDVNNDDIFQNDMWANLMSANFKQLQTVYQDLYSDILNYWQDQGNFMVNASLAGGAGMGFGVQINCGQQVVLSIGGGSGTGFNGMYGNLTAGGGGGAGMQAYGPDGQMLFNTGGGGGGGLHMVGPTIVLPNWGTATDQGQVINKQVFQTLAQTMQTCYQNGNLILRAAGGGGGGLWAGVGSFAPTDDDIPTDDDPQPTRAMAYGGGWGFSFTLASPNGSGTEPDPVIGSELGHVATNCHSKCDLQTPDGTFYTCFCPCLKQGFINLQQPWASHIQCYGQNL